MYFQKRFEEFQPTPEEVDQAELEASAKDFGVSPEQTVDAESNEADPNKDISEIEKRKEKAKEAKEKEAWERGEEISIAKKTFDGASYPPVEVATTNDSVQNKATTNEKIIWGQEGNEGNLGKKVA